MTGGRAPLLSARGLGKSFPSRVGGRDGHLVALRDVDLDLDAGQTLCLVGESGSGKSTLARCLVRLIEPDTGTILFDGVDVRALPGRGLRRMRQRVQLVSQDPAGALDPRWTVRRLVAEGPLAHRRWERGEVRPRVEALLSQVGLGPGLIDRHPRGLSGGERQRVLIARSLALEPEVLICDEPVSSLDTSVRAQVLNLLLDIQRDRELALLFITHDLDVVAGLGAPVVVLYGGQVMERCPGESLRAGRVRHPYTLALLQARPSVLSDGSATGSPWVPRVETEGGPSPEGCPFAHRCPVVEPRCAVERPPPRGIGDGHEAACHLV